MMARREFGARSETSDQLALGLEEEEQKAAFEGRTAAQSEAKKPAPKRRPLPDNLERQDEVLATAEACEDCGGALKFVAEDVTEELDYIPGRFVVRRIRRPRMACRCCDRFHQAPLPARDRQGPAGPRPARSDPDRETLRSLPALPPCVDAPVLARGIRVLASIACGHVSGLVDAVDTDRWP